MARIALLNAHAIPAAGTENNTAVAGLANIGQLELSASFVRGSGGTTVKAYVQTSLDGGSTWIDIACFAFATTTATKLSNVNAGAPLAPASVGTDGALADDTVFEGVIGDQLRVKLVVVGTYAASTISIYAQSKSDISSGGRLPADQGALSVVGVSTVIKPTITVDTGIYAALDVLGALVVSGVVTITGAARISGGSGVIQSIALFDDDNEKNPITLLFFDSAPASGTYIGNGPLALSAGDKAKYVGRVDIAASDYVTMGGDAFVCLKGIGLAFKCVGTANLFMIPLVTSGTPTYTASTDLQMAIGVLQD